MTIKNAHFLTNKVRKFFAVGALALIWSFSAYAEPSSTSDPVDVNAIRDKLQSLGYPVGDKLPSNDEDTQTDQLDSKTLKAARNAAKRLNLKGEDATLQKLSVKLDKIESSAAFPCPPQIREFYERQSRSNLDIEDYKPVSVEMQFTGAYPARYLFDVVMRIEECAPSLLKNEKIRTGLSRGSVETGAEYWEPILKKNDIRILKDATLDDRVLSFVEKLKKKKSKFIDFPVPNQIAEIKRVGYRLSLGDDSQIQKDFDVGVPLYFSKKEGLESWVRYPADSEVNTRCEKLGYTSDKRAKFSCFNMVEAYIYFDSILRRKVIGGYKLNIQHYGLKAAFDFPQEIADVLIADSIQHAISEDMELQEKPWLHPTFSIDRIGRLLQKTGGDEVVKADVLKTVLDGTIVTPIASVAKNPEQLDLYTILVDSSAHLLKENAEFLRLENVAQSNTDELSTFERHDRVGDYSGGSYLKHNSWSNRVMSSDGDVRGLQLGEYSINCESQEFKGIDIDLSVDKTDLQSTRAIEGLKADFGHGIFALNLMDGCRLPSDKDGNTGGRASKNSRTVAFKAKKIHSVITHFVSKDHESFSKNPDFRRVSAQGRINDQTLQKYKGEWMFRLQPPNRSAVISSIAIIEDNSCDQNGRPWPAGSLEANESQFSNKVLILIGAPYKCKGNGVFCNPGTTDSHMRPIQCDVFELNNNSLIIASDQPNSQSTNKPTYYLSDSARLENLNERYLIAPGCDPKSIDVGVEDDKLKGLKLVWNQRDGCSSSWAVPNVASLVSHLLSAPDSDGRCGGAPDIDQPDLTDWFSDARDMKALLIATSDYPANEDEISRNISKHYGVVNWLRACFTDPNKFTVWFEDPDLDDEERKRLLDSDLCQQIVTYIKCEGKDLRLAASDLKQDNPANYLDGSYLLTVPDFSHVHDRANRSVAIAPDFVAFRRYDSKSYAHAMAVLYFEAEKRDFSTRLSRKFAPKLQEFHKNFNWNTCSPEGDEDTRPPCLVICWESCEGVGGTGPNFPLPLNHASHIIFPKWSHEARQLRVIKASEEDKEEIRIMWAKDESETVWAKNLNESWNNQKNLN